MTRSLRLGPLCILWACTSVAQAAAHCIILQYHHIGTETPFSTSVSPALFEAHLDYLADNDFQVLRLGRVIDAVLDGEPLPDRCAAVTMDDAYTSAATEAFPRLLRRGWPLTVFVSTEAIDHGKPAYLDWSTMRHLARAGVRFENHSHTHAHLIRRLTGEDDGAWAERIRGDILLAQRRIEVEIGQTPRFFAYPYGEYDSDLKDLVKGLGLIAYGQQSGPVWPGADPGAIPRFPMAAGFARLETFETKVNALPLPVQEAYPSEPVVPLNEWRPTLTLVLEPGGYRRDSLRCFVNGSPEVTLEWSQDSANTVRVRSNGPLSIGRNRYNCTMPSGEPGRFRWYSHNWIRRHRDGSWHEE